MIFDERIAWQNIVGQRTLIQCGAGVIIVNNAGEKLLGRRKISICGVIWAARLKLIKRLRTVPKENGMKKQGSLQMNYRFLR